MNDWKTILRKARTEKGLTLKKVAAKTGIPFSTVAAWERGQLPTPENRKIIAEFYNIPEKKLFASLGIGAQFGDYETNPIMMHKARWADAEELRPQYDAPDLSALFDKLVSEAKKRPAGPDA